MMLLSSVELLHSRSELTDELYTIIELNSINTELNSDTIVFCSAALQQN